MKAMLFSPDLPQAVEIEVTLDADGDIDLPWLYETLGCQMVQVVPLENGDLWVDEDGKGNDAPLNRTATIFAYGELLPGDCIVGRALYVPRGEI